MNAFDSVIFEFLNGLTGRFFLLDWFFILFSEVLIYVLVGIFFLFLVKIKDWKHRINTLFLGILAVVFSRGIATPLIKFLYERPRPFVELELNSLVSHEITSSFPSGHIAFIIPIVITLWYINKPAGGWFFAGAFLIGISRVAAGVHWPTDILGGFLIGVACFYLAQMVIKRASTHKTKSTS